MTIISGEPDIFQEIEYFQKTANRAYANYKMVKSTCPNLAKIELERMQAAITHRDQLLSQANSETQQKYAELRENSLKELAPMEAERDTVEAQIRSLISSRETLTDDQAKLLRSLISNLRLIELPLAVKVFVI